MRRNDETGLKDDMHTLSKIEMIRFTCAIDLVTIDTREKTRYDVDSSRPVATKKNGDIQCVGTSPASSIWLKS